MTEDRMVKGAEKMKQTTKCILKSLGIQFGIAFVILFGCIIATVIIIYYGTIKPCLIKE